MNRKTRESRVLRARRATTEAVGALRRTEQTGMHPAILQARREEVARAQMIEKTAADAPRRTRIAGFGRNPGKGEFRRG